MRNPLIALVCIVALLTAPPPPAAADTPAGGKVLAKCQPDQKGDYPFDVRRVSQAYGRLSSLPAVDVWVVIGDNGFVGYEQGPGGKRGGANFPDTFFSSDSPTEYRPAKPLIALEAVGVEPEDWGHGTHVAGLVLGGDYGEGEPDVQGLNLALPSVRKLFFKDGKGARSSPNDPAPEPWLNLFVLGLANENSVDLDTFKLGALPGSLLKLHEKSLQDPDIINLSLEHTQVNGDDSEDLERLPMERPKTLWIASAGNDSDPLNPGAGARFPAMATQGLGNLIVVGSYDSNMELSSFSNFESTIVTLAAPGCAIKSWIAAKGAATSLSGTSQSAALVTFAAALLKSKWQLVGPADLRERLIVSSRYSAALANKCQYKDGSDDEVGCVRYGSALDIEVALYWNTDFIEFCVGEKDLAADKCETKSLIGTLDSVPQKFTDCLSNQVSVDNKSGLTKPAAIRFTGVEAVGAGLEPTPAYQILWRVKKPGLAEESLRGKSCIGAQGGVTFRPDPIQPDGKAQGPIEPMPIGRVVRIVTRSR
jgi:hypothetical protein